ncbi:NADH dehydrogenase [ubiquinone] 1 alpha subcomplex assembly factor 3-like [Tubulanus polymorphus]|uniref:NADH dehydrogenase [ubiquinone] 1 alpha subcomplex assembly factor 3-like n=1 Tax=Tubulanus polymorphus TaxID=672921 RepID=UPI003DA54AEE
MLVSRLLSRVQGCAIRVMLAVGPRNKPACFRNYSIGEYTGCSENEAVGGSLKTSTISILNQDQESILINSYSQMGFRLNNGMRVIGPCVIFPNSILQWNVSGSHDINKDSLSLFTVIEPKLDILIIGKGEREAAIDNTILRTLLSHKINVEILSTDQACSTFNFLNSEGRFVAAALIPPSYVDRYHDDSVDLQSALDRQLLDNISDFTVLPKRLQNFSDIPGYANFEETAELGYKSLKGSLAKTKSRIASHTGKGQRMHEEMFKNSQNDRNDKKDDKE